MELLTITEVAKLKEVSRATVYKWIEQGAVDSQTFGNKAKVINNEKLANVEVKKSVQHYIKVHEKRINELGRLVEKQSVKILELETTLALMSTQYVDEKRNVSLPHSDQNVTLRSKKCNVTKSTAKKRKVTKSEGKAKRHVTKNELNGKASEVYALVQECLAKGCAKSKMDNTRGNAVGRFLSNPNRSKQETLSIIKNHCLKLLGRAQ